MPLLLLLGMGLFAAAELPEGAAPAPLAQPGFPDRLHAYVWLNWQLTPAARLAEVVGATEEQLAEVARSMGLPAQPELSPEIARRAYITTIRRNWHLLPYDQLLKLLDWTPEELEYTLREDDFLFIKLGNLKPKCEPLAYAPPDDAARAGAARIRAVVAEAFPDGLGGPADDPLFGFVARLSAPPAADEPAPPAGASHFEPRFSSSYFALYGDPLLAPLDDSFPDGYLERLARSGADGVWIQAVLYRLAPFPWEPARSDRYAERLKQLGALVARARSHGLGVYLYLNEPRTMPVSFFKEHPELRGVDENGYATLCTSVPEVRQWLRDSVATVCRAVPDLAGMFTISASENLTTCWSHFGGAKCPRCAGRGGAEVIADLHAALREGMDDAGVKTRLIAWDWGWRDEWVKDLVAGLPKGTTVQSVSEWEVPITRGGVSSAIGEYSLSAIGPGPRARRNWAAAREAGLPVMAKIQANVTWELGSVPFIPVVRSVAEHATRLRAEGISGLMLCWTLGGCPSPNLDVLAEIGRMETPDPDAAVRAMAERRYGAAAAPEAVRAFQAISGTFPEYPYSGGTVYVAPQHMGPANPLWEKPTGYAATMVGFPYDDLKGWRAIYPPEVFADQFEKTAQGFFEAARIMLDVPPGGDARQAALLREDARIAEACGIHFQSVAHQTRFTLARNQLAEAKTAAEAAPLMETLETALRGEMDLALRLYAVQTADSRVGYEATNHYFYIPYDLAAKVVNCRDLLERWLPEQRARY